MNRDAPTMRGFAARLIAYECRSRQTEPSDHPAAFQVCEKLRPHLAMLMGNGGFCALFARALSLASVSVPWLGAVSLKADGSLESLGKRPRKVAGGKTEDDDGVEVLAQLLGLLVAFIGENLTRRLMLEVWPKLPRKDLEFGKGNKK
ncbi:MAG: hypothetical protein ABW223_01670 [Rariglobus sp.]